ncbi:MAG: SGNH/GDSL hydrolase family protein [Bordetella sp.]|uniref:SGNH/GDSL hydrolase family protein n=1 Tax=Bordetella sp. TaxID=28081 RepID=UPI003F7B3B23
MKILPALSAALTVAAALSVTPSAQAAAVWQAAWATSLQSVPDLANPPGLYARPEVAGRTFRQIIHSDLDGSEARLRVSNRYGSQPLVVERATLARSDGAAGLATGKVAAVTFGGHASLTLPPGAEADSDAIAFPIVHGQALAVSLTLGTRQTMQAWHRIANRVNFISTPGEHAATASSADFRARTTHYAWITQLSVPGTAAGSLVAIGDSITDGLRSTFGARHGWPEDLARRAAADGQPPVAVLNAGISGNRLLSDSPCYGERLAGRFDHDAAELPGVRAVILLIGINDINFAATPARRGLDCDAPHTRVTANDLIMGYKRIIADAHRRGLRIFGGTLTPAALPPEREALRETVNQWIRRGGGFDGVVDFDAALRDPRRPNQLLPAYDSGDGIHPSDAGYAAMAKVVPLARLRDILSHP